MTDRLTISECEKCHQVFWPENNVCSSCLGKTNSRNMNTLGKIIEFSKKDDTVFAIAEFEDKIRLIGKIAGNQIPKESQKVKLAKVDIKDDNYTFDMNLF